MHDPFTDLDINCRAQLSLLEACRRTNPTVKIVFASTRQIYGRPDYLPVDEKHLLHPTDVNGINKMAGEWYHILYNNVYGLRACSLRLTNTYGPRMLVKNNRQTAIGWFIRQILDDEEVQIFGDGIAASGLHLRGRRGRRLPAGRAPRTSRTGRCSISAAPSRSACATCST